MATVKRFVVAEMKELIYYIQWRIYIWRMRNSSMATMGYDSYQGWFKGKR